jgi:hypothetical protein
VPHCFPLQNAGLLQLRDICGSVPDNELKTSSILTGLYRNVRIIVLSSSKHVVERRWGRYVRVGPMTLLMPYDCSLSFSKHTSTHHFLLLFFPGIHYLQETCIKMRLGADRYQLWHFKWSFKKFAQLCTFVV